MRLGREVLRHHTDLHERIRSTLIADDVEVRMNGIESSVFDGGYCPALLAVPVQVAAHHVEIKAVWQILQFLRSHHKILLYRRHGLTPRSMSVIGISRQLSSATVIL